MDNIDVAGVTYTKITVLAKKFRYTTDYIGQLCRANKINCQLVGRSWYAQEEDLLTHKDNRYKSTRLNEKTIKINTQITNQEVSVKPRLLNKTAKRTAVFAFEIPINRPGAGFSKYLPDESVLQPLAGNDNENNIKTASKSLPFVLAEATKVKIKPEVRSKIQLDFTPLPEVSLRGSVAVKSVIMPELPVINFNNSLKLQNATPVSFKTGAPHQYQYSNKILNRTRPPRYTPASIHENVTISAMNSRFNWLFLSAIASAVITFGFALSTAQQFSFYENGRLVSAVTFSGATWDALWTFFSRFL